MTLPSREADSNFQFPATVSFVKPRREGADVARSYDNDEQHRIIAEDVEDYLVPIYKTEAMFVLPILSPTYPTRIWAKIESDAFKERFGQSAVIPIKLSTVQEGFFNDYMRYGYLALDMSGDIEAQLINIADTLGRRMLDERAQSANEAVAAEA
jgi:hypothetical protein